MDMNRRRRDRVDIEGIPDEGAGADPGHESSPAGSPRKFISVHYTCCNTYGRMYPDAARTRYVGRCPKCGATVEAKIGPGGTNRRMFDTK